MKKTLMTLLVVGAISVSSCKKDELSTPDIKQQINGVDSKILCTNCGGGWELSDPSATPQSTTLRIVATDTVPVVKKPIKKDTQVKISNPKKK